MTREEAQQRAGALDEKTHAEISARPYPSAREVLSQIRAYLIRRSEEMTQNLNNPIALLKFRQEKNGMALIVLGPTFDKGSTTEHFHFVSGARLSFGVTLRKRGSGSELLSFRFHYHLNAGKSPEYFRFDLNEALHEDPLFEPRCHLHPGLEDVRIPLPIHNPVEILDRIFFVLDGN